MKKLILILFLFISIVVKSATYYVATTGSDAAAGTLAAPWASWQKAFNTADAGDTVYFRGGVWYLTTDEYIRLDPDTGYGHNGTYANPICFFNYPGEEPILDAINHTNTSHATAFDVRNATYIKLRGLTIRNEKQNGVGQWIASMLFYLNGNLYLDRIKCHDGGGYGIWFQGYDTLYITNTDSYGHYDPLGDPDGGRADGFQVSSGVGADSTAYTVITGCRAWNNSDDGFEISTPYQLQVYNNWAFANGLTSAYGEGGSYKYGIAALRISSKRKTYNNIAAFSHGDAFGFENLTHATYGPVMEFYNNTAYRCRINYSSDQGSFNCSTGYTKLVYKNNIAYKGTYSSNQYYLNYVTICQSIQTTQTNNNFKYLSDSPYWQYNTDVSVSDADFLTVDSLNAISELSTPRKADGSLPEITFLKLTAGSDLIDAGVDVGLPYEGSAPDIGYDEWIDAPDSTATDILTYTFPEQTGLATINTTEHTVAISVTAETDVSTLTPTITLSYGATIDPLSGVEDDFTDPVVYTVTALDGETTQEWTVTVTVGDPDVPTVTTSLVTTYNAASATLSGEVISNGATTLTATGFVWSTSESPTLSSGNIVPNTTRTETTFSNSISPLQKGTTYHIRAFGTNSAGTAYGSDVSFTTPALGMIQSGGKSLFYNGKQIIY